MNNTGHQSGGFSPFAFTWAMACLFHQLSYPDWRWHDKGLLLTVAILFVLHKPSSWRRFAVFVVIDWLIVGWTFPNHPNHIVFSWVINTTILTSLVIVSFKDRGIKGPDMPSRWFAVFAPWLRIEMCILYFFAVFHKLNAAYFNVDYSCAAKLYLEINNRLPVMPEGKWALNAAIYGSLITELAIPLLLLFRRTCVIGVFIGLLFHGLLALHNHMGLFSFSSTMIAIFTTFLPVSIVEWKPGETARKIWRWGLIGFSVLLVVWILRDLLPFVSYLEELQYYHLWKVGFFVFYIYLAFALVILFHVQKKKWKEMQERAGTWKTHPGLIAFCVILVINGLGPYFGLKTQTSFSMFSNLQTENGVTNHLIMPSGIQLTHWQYDFVEIIDSSDRDLRAARDRDHYVVFLELRRKRTVGGPYFWVTFRRNGKDETFDMKKPETHSVLKTLGPLTKRYFYFRTFAKDPLKATCQQ